MIELITLAPGAIDSIKFPMALFYIHCSLHSLHSPHSLRRLLVRKTCGHERPSSLSPCELLLHLEYCQMSEAVKGDVLTDYRRACHNGRATTRTFLRETGDIHYFLMFVDFQGTKIEANCSSPSLLNMIHFKGSTLRGRQFRSLIPNPTLDRLMNSSARRRASRKLPTDSISRASRDV